MSAQGGGEMLEAFAYSRWRGFLRRIQVLAAVLFLHGQVTAQTLGRIEYNGKEIFLSGINVAWVNYSADLGPNPPSLYDFRAIFQQVRDSGGNALRLWLYTTGANAPTYNSLGYVTGPGPVAIQNLREILSMAHQYRVGLILCLWSFDMLGKHEGLDSTLLYANEKMLTDTSFTMAFVRNALTPLIDSVKTSPAIIAWEVCNEPNGMVTGLEYYPEDPTVPMSAVQRFTNLIAGGIHRADPSALVTLGAGSFNTLTDVNLPAAEKKTELKTISSLSPEELRALTQNFNVAHRLDLTTEEMQNYLERIASIPDSNYYSDRNLIAAGGDSLGTLNFYSVHYYGPESLSPFVNKFSYWQLDKPTVAAEFYMQPTDGLLDSEMFPALYNNGYAGALVWSWTDFSKTPNNSAYAASDTWSALNYMWTNYNPDVNVFDATWPSISIIAPENNSAFPDSTELTLAAAVVDTASSITSVRFYEGDSLLGSLVAPSSSVSDTNFYSFLWTNVPNGTYSITAAATDANGAQDSSTVSIVTVGLPLMTQLGAKRAIIHEPTGGGITLKSDPTASGGYYLDIGTDDTNATITWKFLNVDTAGIYPVSISFKLAYASPKTQYINVNGARADTVTFSGSTSSWMEKTIYVHLSSDTNTIQLQMFWGYMYVDYLAVPNGVMTSVIASNRQPTAYYLSQNYPNPFNPTTQIDYTLSQRSLVSITVYDILGRKVEALFSGIQTPGPHVVTFDGDRFASGVYFYRFVVRPDPVGTGSYVKTMKMLLLK